MEEFYVVIADHHPMIQAEYSLCAGINAEVLYKTKEEAQKVLDIYQVKAADRHKYFYRIAKLSFLD